MPDPAPVNGTRPTWDLIRLPLIEASRKATLQTPLRSAVFFPASFGSYQTKTSSDL